MPIFNFTLSGPYVTSQRQTGRCALAAGHSDALVCFYGTAVYLEFDREGQSLSRRLCPPSAMGTAALPDIRVESIDSTAGRAERYRRTYRRLPPAIALLRAALAAAGAVSPAPYSA